MVGNCLMSKLFVCAPKNPTIASKLFWIVESKSNSGSSSCIWAVKVFTGVTTLFKEISCSSNEYSISFPDWPNASRKLSYKFSKAFKSNGNKLVNFSPICSTKPRNKEPLFSFNCFILFNWVEISLSKLDIFSWIGVLSSLVILSTRPNSAFSIWVWIASKTAFISVLLFFISWIVFSIFSDSKSLVIPGFAACNCSINWVNKVLFSSILRPFTFGTRRPNKEKVWPNTVSTALKLSPIVSFNAVEIIPFVFLSLFPKDNNIFSKFPMVRFMIPSMPFLIRVVGLRFEIFCSNNFVISNLPRNPSWTCPFAVSNFLTKSFKSVRFKFFAASLNLPKVLSVNLLNTDSNSVTFDFLI